MRTVFLLLIFCHVASTVKHSLEYLFTSSNGLWEFPEFVGALMVDGVQLSYWDSNRKTVKTDDWMTEFMRDNPDHLQWYSRECLKNQYDFRSLMGDIRQHLNQSEGVHILQMRGGCEWDEENEETASFMTYGYDGEDFMALDPQQLTWRALKPEALSTKLVWDTYNHRLEYIKRFYINDCPIQLKKYVPYVRKLIQRTVLPSVSLLQKSPSSPVSCFATGFYPDRAVMFWRKDGEEIYKGMEHGEILPNNDHTFQMSADLNISSVKPKDWKKYDCVFQLSGVEEDIISRLDKPSLTNTDTNIAGFDYWLYVSPGFAAVLLLVCLFGFLIWRKKKKGMTQASSRTEPPSSTPLLILDNTLIIGDSIIEKIHLSKAIIKGFSGATIPRIQEELLKILPSLPPSVSRIVLHAGTDDTTCTEEITMNLNSLFQVLKDTGKTVFISGPIPALSGSAWVTHVNTELCIACTTYKFIFVNNVNISWDEGSIFLLDAASRERWVCQMLTENILREICFSQHLTV
ncbi:major histocompatibility complex class I-related gene protein-like [Cheilinus undulatus]|uniref:major histocompatibility complex class I-related gene protein-like n=1 Tax=Cheilinus undulatus TaxID=241271 RepID=UPI001BD698BB|nr:major histocompatibility complex class I-related gene protein-like [Cheilinus undulatus]